MKNEVVFSDIFIHSMVRTANEKNGAMAIACSPDIVQGIYDSLVKSFWSMFF